MPTYLLTLEYDGTDFSGWQIQRTRGQERARTVQSEVEKILNKIPGYDGKTFAASRTDAGVHARDQKVSFTLHKPIPPRDLFMRLDALLPNDAAPRDIRIVPDNFNARYHAKKKEYVYSIYNDHVRPVLEQRFVWWRKAKLDIQKMKQAARYYKGTHDFKAFMREGSSQKDTHCTIYKVALVKKDKLLKIRITGSRFLYNMVRNMAGLLVEVGRGKVKPTIVKEYLRFPSIKKAGPKAPAQGLTLHKVIGGQIST
ncbi:MAG: tRNA pseudouridine(38-40) synthase TruA [bacterium]